MSTGMHGSGFFIRSGDHCFVVTALHCITKPGQSLKDNVRNLLIPTPFRKYIKGLRKRIQNSAEEVSNTIQKTKQKTNSFGSPRRDFWLAFTEVITAKALVRTDEFTQNGEFDIAVLPLTELSTRARSAVLSNAIKLPLTGKWFDEFVRKNKSSEKIWLRARGFPQNGTKSEITYESKTIVQQGVHLIGHLTGLGPFPHSMSANFENGTPVLDINGLSGGPVFLRLASDKGNFNYYLVGMMTNGHPRACTFVTVQFLTAIVNRWVADHDAMKHNGGHRTISNRQETTS